MNKKMKKLKEKFYSVEEKKGVDVNKDVASFAMLLDDVPTNFYNQSCHWAVLHPETRWKNIEEIYLHTRINPHYTEEQEKLYYNWLFTESSMRRAVKLIDEEGVFVDTSAPCCLVKLLAVASRYPTEVGGYDTARLLKHWFPLVEAGINKSLAFILIHHCTPYDVRKVMFSARGGGGLHDAYSSNSWYISRLKVFANNTGKRQASYIKDNSNSAWSYGNGRGGLVSQYPLFLSLNKKVFSMEEFIEVCKSIQNELGV